MELVPRASWAAATEALAESCGEFEAEAQEGFAGARGQSGCGASTGCRMLLRRLQLLEGSWAAGAQALQAGWLRRSLRMMHRRLLQRRRRRNWRSHPRRRGRTDLRRCCGGAGVGGGSGARDGGGGRRDE